MTRNRKPPSGTPSESGREGAYLRGDVSQRPAESSVLSRGLENERGRRLGIAAPPTTRQDSGRRRPRPEAPEDRRRGPWHAAVCPGSGSPRTTPRTGEGQGTAGRAPGDTRLTVTCRVTVPATIPSGAGGTVRRGRERVCSAPRRPARLLGRGPRGSWGSAHGFSSSLALTHPFIRVISRLPPSAPECGLRGYGTVCSAPPVPGPLRARSTPAAQMPGTERASRSGAEAWRARRPVGVGQGGTWLWRGEGGAAGARATRPPLSPRSPASTWATEADSPVT